MRIDDAIAAVERTFPIAGYVHQNSASYRTLAEVALRYLSSGGSILDIGSGPCDKVAVLQELGFRCTAIDDLEDPWHKQGDTARRILEFARSEGIEFHVASAASLPFSGRNFGMVMLCDVIEHLHSSPRELLFTAIDSIQPEGILVITVPNAANLRKRLDLLVGRTNLPPFDSYFWWRGEWRGHIREYVRDDLERLTRYLGLELLELRGVSHMLEKLPPVLRGPFVGLTRYAQGLRDSWILVARRPKAWSPTRERIDC